MTKAAFLAPGFLVALGGSKRIRFPHVTGGLRLANPGRLAVVDALSRGLGRDLDAMVAEIADRIGAEPVALQRFVDGLEAAGCLTEHDPSVQPRTPLVDAGEPWTVPDEVRLVVPTSLIVDHGEYLWYDHEGTLRLTLTLGEVNAARMFTARTTVEEARTRHLGNSDETKLADDQFDDLVARLGQVGLLREVQPVTDAGGQAPVFVTDGKALVQEAVDAVVAEFDERMAATPGDRVPVVPVNTDHGVAPTALGLLIAFAMEYDGGRLKNRYDFVPMFLTDESRLTERAAQPGIFLFSNYVWNVEENLKLSAAVKDANPASITIHGGPSTPKYDVDAEEFFRDHPHVDVAVRGEGELTFAALLDALGPGGFDLERLRDVEGVTYRTADGVHRTEDRDRIADLDTIPSPYLMGLLDAFGGAGAGVIIETNRGCPYGCTFCDWGSATLSRIRKFSLDRVFAELEWGANQQIEIAAIADANFGIMERDVEIAEKIAELKRAHGFPRTVATNYAKNTVKHLRHIIEILADVEILTEGVVSLQSMDEPTLKIIKRSNIKLEKYNELATEFRRAKLPLAADIMMGLPGSTPESFRTDLQKCTDRDVRIRANPTQLLPNSPMNEPSYRKEHGIVAAPGEFVMESATFTRAEWEDMNELRSAYYIFDNWGVLRYVARHVRSVTGLGEVDFYDTVRRAAHGKPEEWPILHTTLRVLESYMAPPGSWGLFIEEVRRFLIERLDVADDSALRTALAVQHAHLPAPERVFPLTLELEHDFTTWQNEILALREEGHRDDWELHVAPLVDFAPATLTIGDPNSICQHDVGKPMAALAFALRSWELDSPVARPRLGAAV